MIGAMAVVLQDVPAGATAVGNPARIIAAAERIAAAA
jgi:serine acetyltransferase